MGAAIPKALTPLLGEPLLAWAVNTLLESEAFSEVFVAVPAGKEDAFRSGLAEAEPRLRLIVGGATRQESVANCLAKVSAECDIIAVHDAARPLLTQEVLLNTLNRANEMGAAIAAVPAKDTVKLCSEDGIVTDTPDRSRLWLVQTPQCFSHELLVSAHEKARSEGYLATDDASLIERLGAPVSVVMGSYENIKVTTPEDILVCEEILKGRSSR
jgi:2-C-methyl-D-erythritol 4-phosphate cytidylyltransferase